jgi:hypothetical protein
VIIETEGQRHKVRLGNANAALGPVEGLAHDRMFFLKARKGRVRLAQKARSQSFDQPAVRLALFVEQNVNVEADPDAAESKLLYSLRADRAALQPNEQLGGAGRQHISLESGPSPRHVVLALDFVVKLDDQGCIAGFAILGRREVNDAAAFIERTVGDSQR